MENSELIATMDATLAELRRRLDAFVERGADDIVAADEGFALAGMVYASAREAEEHASKVRTQLEDANRDTG